MNVLPITYCYMSRRIAARLAAEYGIEKMPEEVWERVLDDAGRDYMMGLEMLADVDQFPRCFEGFAKTFIDPSQENVDTFEVVEPNRKLEVVCVAICAACFGFAFGILL